MTTYVPKLNRTVFSGDCAGNASIFTDYTTTTAAAGIGDLLRIAAIPGGSLVSRVVVKNDDLDSGTTLQGKIGFRADDGSLIPATPAVADFTACVAAVGAWGQAPATTTYEIFPPILVPKDAHLVVEVTTAGTANVGNVYGKVECENLGVK